MKKWSKLSKLKLIYGLKIFLLICFEYISYFFHFSSAIAALIELSINLIVLILIINLCLKFIHAVALGLEKKKKNKIEENSVIAKDVLKPGIEFTLNYIRSQESKQRLFNLMSEEHNLTLLDSELVDIIFSLSVGLTEEKKEVNNQIAYNSVTSNDVLKPGIEFTLNYIRSQEARQRLFNLMSEKHNLTLLNSELVDIIFSLSVYIP